jgi:hypothetical protein
MLYELHWKATRLAVEEAKTVLALSSYIRTPVNVPLYVAFQGLFSG